MMKTGSTEMRKVFKKQVSRFHLSKQSAGRPDQTCGFTGKKIIAVHKTKDFVTLKIVVSDRWTGKIQLSVGY